MCKIPFLLTSILSDMSPDELAFQMHQRVGRLVVVEFRAGGAAGWTLLAATVLLSAAPLLLRISPKDNLPGCVRWTQGPVVWEVPQAGYEYKRNNVVVVCDVTRSYPTFSRDFLFACKLLQALDLQ